MKKITLILLFLLFGIQGYGQSLYQDTRGNLEVSSSGQATYTVPIALPPTPMSFAPKMDLVYQSGILTGVAGVGWSIQSISAISRIATRLDLDGFKDGVDFDDNDKLALDGQRLMLVSGEYWKDGSVYQTEMKSNIKVELKGTGDNISFVVSYPNGSKAWYGVYGTRKVKDDFTYYILMQKDANGNKIRYEYSRPFGNDLHIDKILFGNYKNISDEIDFSEVGDIVSGGIGTLRTNGNYIKFNYKKAARVEKGYAGGKEVFKTATLGDIYVFSEGSLFKKYVLTHSTDSDSGFEKVMKIQEFNAGNEPANPILFEYEQTIKDYIEENKTYTEGFNFESIELTGDFDGDGRMDFIANSKLYKKLFSGSTPISPLSLNLEGNQRTILAASTLDVTNNLKNFNSLVNVISEKDGVKFKIYDVKDNQVFDYEKKVLFENVRQEIPYCPCHKEPCLIKQYAKERNSYIVGDFDGDGISEVLIRTYYEERRDVLDTSRPHSTNVDPCNQIFPTVPEFYVGEHPEEIFIVDLNRNKGTGSQSNGFFQMSFEQRSLLKGDSMVAGDFNGDGKTDFLIIEKKTKTYKVVTFNKNAQGIYNEIEIIGQGVLSDYTNKQILLGDFNGDGKLDFLTAVEEGSGKDQWYVYYANPRPDKGDMFVKEKHQITEYWPQSGRDDFDTQTQHNNYYSLDVNGDGKTDLVRIWRKVYKKDWTINNRDTEWSISVFENKHGNTSLSDNRMFVEAHKTGNHRAWMPSLPIPLVSPYEYNGQQRDIAMIRMQNTEVHFLQIKKDYAKEANLKMVTSTGGKIEYQINYDLLESGKKDNTGQVYYYKDNSPASFYPNVSLTDNKDMYVVTRLQRNVGGDVLFQDFKYHNYSVNMHYGAVGMEKFTKSSWYKDRGEGKKWSTTVFDIQKRGVVSKAYTYLGKDYWRNTLVSNDPAVIGFTENNYLMSVDNKITRIGLDQESQYDNLTKLKTEKTYGYSSDYDLPRLQTTRNFLNGVEQGKTVETIEYNNINSGANYFIGNPKKISTATSVYGDKYSTVKEIEYDLKGNILKTILKKPSYLKASSVGGGGIGEFVPLDGGTVNPVGESASNPNGGVIPFPGLDTKMDFIEKYKYDSTGNIIEKEVSVEGDGVSMAARKTSFKFDDSRRFPVESTDVEGLKTIKRFHLIYGQLLTVEDPFGKVTKFEYDNWGKLVKETDFLGNSNTYKYSIEDTNNNLRPRYVVEKNNADGSWTRTVANILGVNVFSSSNTIDNKALKSAVFYDAYGRKNMEEGPAVETQSISTSYVYDPYERIKEINHSSGKKIQLTFDGLKTSVYDGFKTESTTKNGNGHQVASADPGGEVVYAYNAQGKVKSYTFDGTTVSIEYDAWGRKTKLTDPSAGEYTYAYNPFGELIKETTPKGTTTLEYDAVGKLVKKQVVGDDTNQEISYSYNPTTKLLQSSVAVIDGNSTSYSYEYNNHLQLIKTVEARDQVTFIKQVTYDGLGRVATNLSKTVAFGKTFETNTRQTYKNGYPWQLIDIATSKVLTENKTTDNFGNISNRSLGNGLDEEYGYDSQSFPVSRSVLKPGERFLWGSNTTFDPVRGNLLSRVSMVDAPHLNMVVMENPEFFEYDTLDRLTSFTNGLGAQEIQTYDNKGRITSNVLGSYQYNGTKKYQLDQINLSTKSLGYYQDRPKLEISYNAFKSPVAIHESGKEDIYFDYNDLGNRSVMYYGNIAEDKSQSLFKRYYSADGSVEITYDTRTATIDYLHYVDGDAYTADVIRKSGVGNGGLFSASAYYYLHRDYQSSIVAITNSIGEVVEKRRFDAWGNIISVKDGQGNELGKLTFIDRGYTGHEHLQGVKLIHMNGRLYDPVLKRFLAPDNYIQDPTNSQNFNRYGYVLNNPLKYTDPSGEEAAALLIGAAIGVGIAMLSYTMTALLADVPFTAGGFLKSVIFGAISGAASGGIGELFLGPVTVLSASSQALMHGASQSIITVMQGGDVGFASFAAAAVSSLVFAGFTEWTGAYKGSEWVNAAFSTLSGGASAELTGGNFWQGAATALVVVGANHLMHMSDDPVVDDNIHINTKEKTVTVERTNDDFDRIFVNGSESFATPRGALSSDLRELNYNIIMNGPKGVGMGLTDFVLDAFNLITGAAEIKMGVTMVSKSSLGLKVLGGASKGTLNSSVFYSRTLGINYKMPVRLPTIVGKPTNNLGVFLGRNAAVFGSTRAAAGAYGIYN